jgi:glucosamine--fructose-6-phosphate aminotransferase (isomerizing)
MCGIVGYIGPREAEPILMDGLARLEYRGYDSAGIAVLDPAGDISVRKRAGKLQNLANALSQQHLLGSRGVGHTRWATHGRPNDENAHPHQDCTGDIALVHNGIIENYLELRHQLLAEGHRFQSETDTEVLAHLLERELAQGAPSLTVAMLRMLPRLRGAYAIVAMARREPDVLVGTRSDVPLIAGLSDHENYFASDMTALLHHTRRMLTLLDGEVATLTAQGVTITALDGTRVFREPIAIDWDAQAAEKGGYPHFLLKEMMEQPTAVRHALMGRMAATSDGVRPVLAELSELLAPEALAGTRRIVTLACGTSYYAGLIAKAMIERWARLPVETWIASEFRYADPIVGPDTLVVAITQSGETADTIAAIRRARAAGAPVIGITNTVGSAITREVNATVFMQAGPEISVPATKTFVASTTVLTLLALALAQARGTLDPPATADLMRQLESLPTLMEETLAIVDDPENPIHQTARWLAQCQSAMFIGRGVGYALAREGALKLKEVSYIHAEGYPAGELKHGPITLLDPQTPLVAVALESGTYEKIISNIQEVRARHARIVALATAGDSDIRHHAEDVFFVPRIDELLAPALGVIPLQLLAYYTAVERGCDIDQPRNLAKSVTVE